VARIWSGSLTFSLVNIPVTVEAATTSHKIGFRQVHLEDMGRVKYRKTCELDEQVLEQDDIGRAYEAPDGTLVEITDDELDAMPLPTLKTIEVDGFVELATVPPEQLDKPYFLAPTSPAANKPYALMRDALARSGKAAVGKLALRGAEHLALVHPRDDVLVLQLLHWADELRPSADAAPRPDIELSEEELAGAEALIESMSGISVEDYHDEYAEAVQAVLAAKLEGAEPPAPPAPREDKGGAVDLMAALEASVDRARTSRSGGTAQEEGRAREVTGLHEQRTRKQAAKKAAGRQTAAEKAAAGKSSARKSTAKKTAAKKTAASGTGAKKTARSAGRTRRTG
jgi:DNA end-binding protein Ku